MVATRNLRALMVALTVSVSAQASWALGVAEAGKAALEARQVDLILSSASTSTEASTQTATPTPTEVTTTTPPADTTTSLVSTSTTPLTTTTTPPATTTEATTTPPIATSTTNGGTTIISSTPTGGSTTTAPPTSQTTTPPASSVDSATPTQFTESEVTYFSTRIITLDNGSTSASVTAIPTKTSVPLAAGSGSNDEAAQAKNKSVIIGVCVGVGGAIVLAVAGVLFWRLRNKRRQEVDQDELQSFGTSYGAGYGAPSTSEKIEANGTGNSARSPFQSTLESYHAPTQTNAASNF